MTLELIERLTREARGMDVAFLVIGGHAVAHHGYERLTLDIDFLTQGDFREAWQSIMVKLGYSVRGINPAFDQFFHTAPGWPQVDIMYVSKATWTKLHAEAVPKASGRVTVHVPSPEHLVALKLHAACDPQRKDSAKDWNDILHLVRRHKLDPEESEFSALVIRYGGPKGLEKLKSLMKTP